MGSKPSDWEASLTTGGLESEGVSQCHVDAIHIVDEETTLLQLWGMVNVWTAKNR